MKQYFLKAAEAIDNGAIDFSCSAIQFYSGIEDVKLASKLRSEYSNLLAEHEGERLQIESFVGNLHDCTNENAKELRVLALLFAGEALSNE